MDLKRYFRGPFVAVLVMLLLFFVVFAYADRGISYKLDTTSDIVHLIDTGQVKTATLIDKNQTIEVATRDGRYLQADWVGNQGQILAQDLQNQVNKGTTQSYSVEVPSGNSLLGVIIGFLPYVLILLFFFFLLNQMQGGGSR